MESLTQRIFNDGQPRRESSRIACTGEEGAAIEIDGRTRRRTERRRVREKVLDIARRSEWVVGRGGKEGEASSTDRSFCSGQSVFAWF